MTSHTDEVREWPELRTDCLQVARALDRLGDELHLLEDKHPEPTAIQLHLACQAHCIAQAIERAGKRLKNNSREVIEGYLEQPRKADVQGYKISWTRTHGTGKLDPESWSDAMKKDAGLRLLAMEHDGLTKSLKEAQAPHRLPKDNFRVTEPRV